MNRSGRGDDSGPNQGCRPVVVESPMRTRILLLGILLVAAFAGQGRLEAGPEPRARVFGPSGLSAVRDADRLRGSFWAPAGSAAVRPALVLSRSSWSPRRSAQ